jgi:class 3 adenylate cyclase
LEPLTGYADLEDQRIAYQVIGDGPVDIVYTAGFWGSFDIEWEEPAHRLFFQQLASFSRLIRFDMRGTGASDPIPLDAPPPWESFAEEIEAVMDAVGSAQAVLIAGGPAPPAALLFTATRPERVRALILFMAAVRYLEDDDYEIGLSPHQLAARMSDFEAGWGTGETFDLLFPSRAGDERLRAWYAKFQRLISSPGAIQRYQEAAASADARSLLSSIAVPTMVMHPRGNAFVPLPLARYIAEHIDGAEFLELPGADVAPFWERPDVALEAIERFVVGTPRAPAADRQLATVLFTDIVDSTGIAEALGDRRWAAVLDLHDDAARSLVETGSGRLIKTTGDGILATFDGPGRAIRCAIALHDELARADLRIRAGIHTGEVEFRGDDVGGIAVHLASRIMSVADPGETLVSNTVKDLVIGSDLAFEDRGVNLLKGIEGRWQLYAVVDRP